MAYNISYADKRRELELLRGELETERSTFLTHWRQLADFILPRRPRFEVTDINKGDKRNQNIIDSTATFAARTLSSGMMSGITSPARPWFRLTTEDPKMAERGAVKEWLSDVSARMNTVYLKSNIYNKLPVIYGDMGVFGTSALLIEEDFKNVLRTQAVPIGSYSISSNESGRVDVFMRQYQMTVRQLVAMFGYDTPGGEIQWDNFSTQVKSLWDIGEKESWIQVTHTIRPNPDYDPDKALAKYKKYQSCYYETGYGAQQSYDSPDARKYLRESGYDYFPVLCPRWSITGEDTYGTDCPGMTALGDIRSLQILQKRKANAIDKTINPPLVGGIALKNTRISHLPGDVSFSSERDGEKGLRPIYEVRFDFNATLEDIRETQSRIKRAFYEDLFLMISNDERTQPPTAEEIIERRSEKMIAVGPVLEQLNQDLLDPLIDITFAMMERQGLVPQVPEELSQVALKVEYVSIMSQAQKLVGISGIERFAGFTFKIAADSQDPTVVDKVDKDQLVDEYADALGISPRIVRSDDAVAVIRAQRAKQENLARMEQASNVAMNSASAAKDLSQTPVGNTNALEGLLQQANAGSAG